jgi:hypothetical protein
MDLASGSRVRAIQVLVCLFIAFFCLPYIANALWVGGNIDVHNNTGQDAYDFHIKGVIKSTCPPTLGKAIGYVTLPDGNVLYPPDPTYSINHISGDLWSFDAEWKWPFGIPHCSVGHFGLFFQACCRNVWVNLDGWWTGENGEPIGDWPILGFEVPKHHWDPPEEQFFRLRGDAGNSPIPVEILEIRLAAMPPPANDREAEEIFMMLNAEDMDALNWVSSRNLPEGPFTADSFFDVFFEAEEFEVLTLTKGMEPNELLLVATHATWEVAPQGEKRPGGSFMLIKPTRSLILEMHQMIHIPRCWRIMERAIFLMV